jgi:hypothetical protein
MADRVSEITENLYRITKLLEELIHSIQQQLLQQRTPLSYATTIAMGISVAALLYAVYDHRSTAKNLTDMTTVIKGIDRRTTIVWALSNLQDEIWPSYKAVIRKEAIDATPRYLEDSLGKPTTDGLKLLDSNTMMKVENLIAQMAPDYPSKMEVPSNKILLSFNLIELYNKAEKKGVSLNILLAVLNGYADKIKGKFDNR